MVAVKTRGSAINEQVIWKTRSLKDETGLYWQTTMGGEAPTWNTHGYREKLFLPQQRVLESRQAWSQWLLAATECSTKKVAVRQESGPLSRELSMEQLGPTTLSPALCGLQPPGFTPSWSSWPALSGEEGLLWKEGPWELVSRQGNESETPG